MLRYAIFDFDGTMADSKRLMLRVYNRIADTHGFRSILEADLNDISAMPILERCRIVGVPVHRLPSLMLEAKRIFAQEAVHLQPFEGIVEMLQTIYEQGVKLAIVSSNSGPTIRQFVKTHGIDFFDNIYTGNNIFGKHTAIRRLLRQTGTREDEAIYIGDELRDVAACRKAGLPMIAVTWGLDASSLLLQGSPTHMVGNAGELTSLVLRLTVEGHANLISG